MKKLLSALLAVLMAATSLTAATSVLGADAKKATVTVSVYDSKFILNPTSLSVSADLSDKYAASVGFNDSGEEPTVLDAVLAIHIKMYGESFTSSAPFKMTEDYGYPQIISAFKKDTSAIGYWLNGVMAGGITDVITDGSYLDFGLYQDDKFWSDKYVSFNTRTAAAGIGDSITLVASYDGYDESWNPVTAAAAGLTVYANGKEIGKTDANGTVTIPVSKKGATLVTADGTLEGAAVFSPYCTVTATELASYVNKQIKSGVKYFTNGKALFTCDEALDFANLLNTGADLSKFAKPFADSVKENLDRNGGKLISFYTNKEDIGLYGAVITALTKLGYNPKSFEGYDIVAAFEAVDIQKSVSSPYYYRFAIEAAEPEFAKVLCDDLISRYYVKGKGLKNYGYSCDNTCYFLTSIAKYKSNYAEYVKDAKAVIKSYKKKNGAYSDDVYVKTVNADSTALSMMAYASVGDAKTAMFYYNCLVKGFEGKTGLFTVDGKVNDYATKESLLALTYFKKAICDAELEHSSEIAVTKVTKATKKKNGKIVKTCKICGKKISTTVIYKPKKIKLSKTKFKYTGKKITPKVTVYNSKGKKIAKKYYTVKYKNNRKKGKATVIVKFKGRYKGTMKKKFRIK